MKRIESIFQFPTLLLAVVLTVAFLIRVYNLNFNSIFVDEAFYILVGKKILEGQIAEAARDTSWLGGFPFIYPLLSGIFYNIAGIIGSRFLNVILGTVSVLFMYLGTKELSLFEKTKNNETAGIIAASLLAIAAIPIEASRLAIYDGLSFMLLIVGLYLLLKGLKTKKNYYYLSSSIVLFLSFLAKYISLVIIPFLIILPLVWIKKKEFFVTFFCAPVIVLLGLYFFLTSSDTIGYLTSQIADPATNYSDVIATFWQYLWIYFPVALIGGIFLWSNNKLKVLGLLFLSSVPILVHILSKNDNSSHQHSFISLIFLLPLIGALFVFFYKKFGSLVVPATLIIMAFVFLYSWSQVRDLENFWPNSSEVAFVLKSKISPNDVILAEGSDSIKLGLGAKVSSEQIVGPFVFEYKGEEGEAAYQKAISEGYFRYVELENVYFPEDTLKKIQSTLPNKYYEIFNDGKIKLYERKPL